MSTGRSAGTLKMMKDYVPLFSTGNYWPYEIADMYGVSHQHMYRLLGDIATTNGVTRESLLIRPHLKEHCNRGIKIRKKGTNEMGTQYIHRLSAKDVRIMIKHGATLVDFCTKYHCDEIALRAQFDRLFKEREANVTWNEMLANAKKLGGGASGGANRTDAAADIIKAADAALTNKTIEAASNTIAGTPKEMATEEEVITAIIPPPRSDLDVLRKRESELLREAEELKQNYFQQDRLYSLACSDAKNLYFRIENLKTEVQKLEQEHEKLQHERNELDAARQKLQEQRQAKDAEICAVQREIADLLTVQLIACENGTIEAVDAPDFKVDDTGFEKLYAGFMEDPAYENLRAKDIRLLARVMCAIYNTKQNVKVLFDSEELQKFFDSLLAPVKLEAVS